MTSPARRPSSSLGSTAVGPGLARELGLAGLIATALSAMVGVGINILPFTLQRSQPGVGAAVPLACLLAAVPAGLAALCYAVLSSAMPRAGGSYVIATRALHPWAGFVASFALWFGLSVATGVVAFLNVPMIRDILANLGRPDLAPLLDHGGLRVPLALAAIWLAWWVNLIGVKFYERIILVMIVAAVVGPLIMITVGATHSSEDYQRALALKSVVQPPAGPLPAFGIAAFLGACVTMFSSFIGFDAVAQAGGEARNASDLPKSILIAIGVVALYYVTFTWAVYHAVPWQHIYRESLAHDVSAPGLLAPLLPSWLGVIILVAVWIAILKVLPALILANSRMLFAFGADRIFPAGLARVHPRYHTPHNALTVTAVFASLSVVGCQVASDFFLGVDMLVLSMLVSFWLTACAVVTFPYINPRLQQRVSFLRSRPAQIAVAGAAMVLLGALLLIQVAADVRSSVPWYLHSTTTWLLVMGAATLLFGNYWSRLTRSGIDPRAEIFSTLPEE